MSTVITMQELLGLPLRATTVDAMVRELTEFTNHHHPRLKTAIWTWAKNAAQGTDAGVPFALVGEVRSGLIRVALLKIVTRARDHIWEQNPQLKKEPVSRGSDEVKFFGITAVLGSGDRFGSDHDAPLRQAKDFLKEVLLSRQDVYAEPDVYQDAQISAHNDDRKIPVELESALEGFGFRINQEHLSSNWKVVGDAAKVANRLYQQGDFDEAFELSDLGLQLIQHITERVVVKGSRYSTGTFTFEVPCIGRPTVQGNLDETARGLIKTLRNIKEQSEMFLAPPSANFEASLPLR